MQKKLRAKVHNLAPRCQTENVTRDRCGSAQHAFELKFISVYSSVYECTIKLIQYIVCMILSSVSVQFAHTTILLREISQPRQFSNAI